MTEKQFEDAIHIKSEIKKLNELLDDVEEQQKICKDTCLKNILDWTHMKAFNEISKLNQNFNNL